MCIKCRIREAIKEPDGSILQDYALVGLGMVLSELMAGIEDDKAAMLIDSIMLWRLAVAQQQEHASAGQQK